MEDLIAARFVQTKQENSELVVGVVLLAPAIHIGKIHEKHTNNHSDDGRKWTSIEIHKRRRISKSIGRMEITWQC